MGSRAGAIRAAETLARHRVAIEADGRRPRDVTARRFFPASHISPQPFRAPLEGIDWFPAHQFAPGRPPRKRAAEQQSPLPEPDDEASAR